MDQQLPAMTAAQGITSCQQRITSCAVLGHVPGYACSLQQPVAPTQDSCCACSILAY